MELPERLQHALTQELAAKRLQGAREELSARYRERPGAATFMSTDAHRYAYLAARMPATYAAVAAVLAEWKARQPAVNVESLLDMGSGPATVLWAAMEAFPSLRSATLVEQDSELASLARRLLDGRAIPQVDWKVQPMQQEGDLATHDLVSFSYSIGELPAAEQLPAIAKGWNAAAKALIVIEPGTPAGFERIRRIRTFLIDAGAYLLAPCPNALPCPMAGTDWCHFAVRLQRSAEHRHAKGATLGYEDEKFSYLIAGRTAADSLPVARVLRHPQKRSGHINLTLCTEGKVANATVSRRDGDRYREARKLEWGDGWT